MTVGLLGLLGLLELSKVLGCFLECVLVLILSFCILHILKMIRIDGLIWC